MVGTGPAPMIKYIGSKRLLVPRILSIVRRLPDVTRVVDLFSGTARVGHALKRSGRKGCWDQLCAAQPPSPSLFSAASAV